mmetsp:Transcript_7492/g.17962  ORF Transcript_7492/g.17962 Transcript_7492/m.17962 type:complete len:305 (+) Transcript_7492:2179-3093(+)
MDCAASAPVKLITPLPRSPSPSPSPRDPQRSFGAQRPSRRALSPGSGPPTAPAAPWQAAPTTLPARPRSHGSIRGRGRQRRPLRPSTATPSSETRGGARASRRRSPRGSRGPRGGASPAAPSAAPQAGRRRAGRGASAPPRRRPGAPSGRSPRRRRHRSAPRSGRPPQRQSQHPLRRRPGRQRGCTRRRGGRLRALAAEIRRGRRPPSPCAASRPRRRSRASCSDASWGGGEARAGGPGRGPMARRPRRGRIHRRPPPPPRAPQGCKRGGRSTRRPLRLAAPPPRGQTAPLKSCSARGGRPRRR